MRTGLFQFPNPVNDVAARTVASGVLALSLTAALTSWLWLTVPLAYGFLARALTGPRLSPLGQLATRVVAPRLARYERLVPGPPKRFAQVIGLGVSTVALCLWVTGAPIASRVVLAVLCVPAALEAGLGFCVGCVLFSWAIRIGLVPEQVCAECADLSVHFRRLGMDTSAS